MRIGQFGKALALSLSLILSGCAVKMQNPPFGKYEIYDIKIMELEKMTNVSGEEIKRESDIRKRYRQALFPFESISEYADKTIKEESGHGNVVGKEYITVEHWIDKELKKKVDGKEILIPLVKYQISLNGKPMERVVAERDYDDRAIYKLPKDMKRLENNLELKENVKLERGDEVFWWGNAQGVFTKTGRPTYNEARIAFFENEKEKFEQFIGIDKKVIPGDSGSLVVKKKTGEIVGVVARFIEKENIGLIIPAYRYCRLKEVEQAKKENPFISGLYNSFTPGTKEWNEDLSRIMSGKK